MARVNLAVEKSTASADSGIGPHGRKIDSRADATVLYLSGLTMQEIADDMGLSKTRVWDYLVEMKVRRRPRGRPKRLRRCPACGHQS
jgi:hypothetical protein